MISRVYLNKWSTDHLRDCGRNIEISIIINHPLSHVLLILARLKYPGNVN